MQFIDKFLRFIAENTLFTSNESILLAVSGGKDSVLMAHLFAEAGFSFGIAHCNFQLRGLASDLDEAFVKDLASQLRVDFYSTRFSTEEYAKENHISIQMAARDLRYQWLKEIRERHRYAYVAVGHHQTDSVETVLLNLSRGTGIAGLSGISPKRDRLIRPLLAFTGKEIEEEMSKKIIAFREDSSNRSTKYKRNSIRLEILPILRKVNPDLEKTFLANSKRFKAVESFLEKSIEEMRPQIFIKASDNEFRIPIAKLQDLSPLDLWLYELFKPYGFTEAVLFDLQRDWGSGSGKQFFSSSHQLVIDRDELILKPIEKDIYQTEPIEELPKIVNWYSKRYKIYSANNEGLVLKDFTQVADFDKMHMPLQVRSWQEGDRFKPLGMKGHKKLSDYFISLKTPLTKKHQVPIIIDSDKSIVAVLPLRIDDRFKITAKTKKVIIFEELNDE